MVLRLPAFGPQTRYRLRRTLILYLLLVVGGAMLAELAEAPGWRAFGFGLIAPGLGFLAFAVGDGVTVALHAGLFLLTLLVFGASVVAWFGAGMAIGPPLVWAGAALAALWMDHPAICAPGSLLLPLASVLSGGAGLAGLALVALAPATAPRTCPAPRPAVPQAPRGELGTDDLARLRFAMDRALQPLERFDGFQWIDQFQPAGMRYQLNFAGYALALAQRRLPAWQGELHAAQRRLIDKQRDWRVWRYWRLENAWGNLRLDADPIIRDNIMYSGFVAAQIALYQAVTGDGRYTERGAFALQTPRGKRFEHDFRSMTDALLRGWRGSPYALMPCEPNWVYPMCNGIGALAVIARDAQLGEAMWPEVAGSLRKGLDAELTARDGRLVAFRSTLTGIAPPRIGGAAAEATPALFYNTSFPDVAARLWEILRTDVLLADGTLRRSAFWKIDTGDYRFSRAASCTAVAAAAIEMGDGEIARLALQLLDAECPATLSGGAIHRDNASVFAHFVELMARLGETGALAGLARAPLGAPRGPVLTEVGYPAVQVARADWRGGALCLTLLPVEAGGESHRIGVAGLRPLGRFRVNDGPLQRVDAEGRASLHIPLEGMTRLYIREVS